MSMLTFQPVGVPFSVASVRGNKTIQQQLVSEGIVPGCAIKKVSSKRGPMVEVEVAGKVLALSAMVLSNIFVV